ncbi:MAG TPA: winged helix-turn-helix transcriptional regulator [Dehalococcoidia bacterium]|nr:winged helix-turn-helix transcriptional regulator [Dehalococcoidia bacterium]
MADWGFITNHGLILAAIARQPSSTARALGDAVGITERAALRIISDLDKEGYISRTKVGRQNHYRINTSVPIKDDFSDAAIGEFLLVLGAKRGKK